MRRTVLILSLLVLSGCETTDPDDWTGGRSTGFKQAERSCGELMQSISAKADRREFFVGCMESLGWSPKPGASIEI